MMVQGREMGTRREEQVAWAGLLNTPCVLSWFIQIIFSVTVLHIFFCQEISFCIDPKAQGARFPSPCLVYSCVFPTVEMCWSQIHEYPWYSSLLCLGMDEGRGANSTLPWTSPGPKWPSHHPGADPVLIN